MNILIRSMLLLVNRLHALMATVFILWLPVLLIYALLHSAALHVLNSDCGHWTVASVFCFLLLLCMIAAAPS